MKHNLSRVWTSICCVVFLLTLTSCAQHQIIPSEEGTPKVINYSEYLRKAWVVDEWEGDVYEYPLSFRISSIEDGEITGFMASGRVAVQNYDFYEPDNFSGSLDNGRAICQFDNGRGRTGEITIDFMEYDNIEASITFTSQDASRTEYVNGVYVFRPYNISDLYLAIPGKEQKIETELDSWGTVFLTTEQIDAGTKSYSLTLLTNSDNDILYEIGTPFKVGMEVAEIEVKDFNEDGLKDIRVLTWGIQDHSFELDFIFYQNEDGSFEAGEVREL